MAHSPSQLRTEVYGKAKSVGELVLWSDVSIKTFWLKPAGVLSDGEKQRVLCAFSLQSGAFLTFWAHEH